MGKWRDMFYIALSWMRENGRFHYRFSLFTSKSKAKEELNQRGDTFLETESDELK